MLGAAFSFGRLVCSFAHFINSFRLASFELDSSYSCVIITESPIESIQYDRTLK